MTHKSKRALFAGSFNPFTIGHASIVARTLSLCDEIVIGIGVNSQKNERETDPNFERICRLYENDNRIKVIKYSGLTVDLARRYEVDFMVRGIRNMADFEYENNLAQINRKISGIETIFLPSLPELTFVSSSMVRELESYGKDVSKFLPNLPPDRKVTKK